MAKLLNMAPSSPDCLVVSPSKIQLAKRTAKRAKAEAELKVATEADDKSDVDKFSKRLVRVTRDHNEDCKKLLSLMGVPVVTVSSPLTLV